MCTLALPPPLGAVGFFQDHRGRDERETLAKSLGMAGSAGGDSWLHVTFWEAKCQQLAVNGHLEQCLQSAGEEEQGFCYFSLSDYTVTKTKEKPMLSGNTNKW